MPGKMLLDGLPSGLWNMQQKVDWFRVAATRLLRHLYVTRGDTARKLIIPASLVPRYWSAPAVAPLLDASRGDLLG